jgi:hypothetical protein
MVAQIGAGAQQAGLPMGAYLSSLAAGAPSLPTRTVWPALAQSTAKMATLARDLRHLAALSSISEFATVRRFDHLPVSRLSSYDACTPAGTRTTGHRNGTSSEAPHWRMTSRSISL